MNDSIIELHNVTKSYPGPVVAKQSAVQGLTLQVRRGERLALLGPSGCGKTTTLRLIAGLERPDQGEICLAGQVVAGARQWAPPEKRRIGMVFQDYALFPHLTVAQNVAFPLRGQSRSQQQTRLRTMLQLVGLEGLAERYPHQLSGGQQQRVALARALAPEPAVVLLDEPFSNLDTDRRLTMRLQVREILQQVGATAIFVTHDQEEALFLGDRVGLMNQGRLEQVSPPEDLYLHPASRFVAEFMGAAFFIPAIIRPHGLETEIGFVAQPTAYSDGTRVEAAARPDDLTMQPDPAGQARIITSVYRGGSYLYEVRLGSGQLVRCEGPHTVNYAPGAPVQVALTPGHALAYFPKQ
jgi:iron(III) transport system ATP-binding protein